MIPKIDILGVKVSDISQNLAVQKILELSRDRKKSHYVVTVNSEFVMLARKNRQFFDILAKADLALPDSAGIVFSKRIFGGCWQRSRTGSKAPKIRKSGPFGCFNLVWRPIYRL